MAASLYSTAIRGETEGPNCYPIRLTPSPQQPLLQHALGGVAADGGDGVHQGDVLGAHLHAVLGLAASLHAALPHDRVESFSRVHRAARMQVEEAHLVERRRSDEVAEG